MQYYDGDMADSKNSSIVEKDYRPPQDGGDSPELPISGYIKKLNSKKPEVQSFDTI